MECLLAAAKIKVTRQEPPPPSLTSLSTQCNQARRVTPGSHGAVTVSMSPHGSLALLSQVLRMSQVLGLPHRLLFTGFDLPSVLT